MGFGGGKHGDRVGAFPLAAADDLRIFDNIITDNGLNHIRPVCGVFILHGENINIERNRIKRNGPRITGDGVIGIRAGIAIQLAGRRFSVDPISGALDIDPDTLNAAACIRGNVVIQPVGRALQLYGLGPMLVTDNHLVNGGLTGTVPLYEAHAVEIINLGQSPELVSEGVAPSFFGFLPVPPLQGAPAGLDDRMVDGRILYTNNRLRLKVDGAPAADMHCAVRLLSYGDVLMQSNQHITTFDRDLGHLTFSTIAIGWSVNASNNRSEDTHLDNNNNVITDVSLVTTAPLNITSSNIATRCIIAFNGASTSVPTDPSLVLTNNIVYYDAGISCTNIGTGIVYWLTFPG